MIFVDTKVIRDVLGAAGGASDWSRHALVDAHGRGRRVMGPSVHPELPGGFASRALWDTVLRQMDICLDAMVAPDALHAAAKPRHDDREEGGHDREEGGHDREAGGQKTQSLPDFPIGAQAMSLGAPLPTRDAR
jgi:hypothetical protein